MAKKFNKMDFVDSHNHYNYDPIFSYLDSVDMVQVWGARSIGKTYSLRKSAVEDFIKRGERFVEVVRFASELDDFATGYFNKFEQNQEFPAYWFKVEAQKAYIAPVSFDEDEAPEWELFGYFVALTNYQQIKKITFANVRKVIFDEAAIEMDDNYHNYLPNEYAKLHSIFTTIAREEPGKKCRTKLFLLGNSCDLLNPSVRMLKLKRPPKFGLSFYNGGSVLVHYVEPWDAEERRKNTATGRLANLLEGDASLFDNEFSYSEDFVKRKPSKAKFMFGLRYGGMLFGIWATFDEGEIFVNKKVPNGGRVVALTKKDHTVDSQAIKKNSKIIKNLESAYYNNAFNYEDLVVKEDFLEVLSFFGIK